MENYLITEAETRSRYITPAIIAAGWDIKRQVREEYQVSAGRVQVRGRLASRTAARSADYVLCYKPNMPIAVIEAKAYKYSLGSGMQQAQDYAEKLDVPFAISSNGQGFLFNDRHGLLFSDIETELPLSALPAPEVLWAAYCRYKNIPAQNLSVVEQPYYDDGLGRAPRYYQMVAINRTLEAIARGQQRLLLVMATGTGKTYTAFQIIWRLWKSKQKKRILFLADRNILVDQTFVGDFKPFGGAMAKLSPNAAGMERNGKQVDITLAVDKQKNAVNKVNTAYEIYLGLYQALSGSEEERNVYKQFSPDFFDLIVIDECHRGSAAEDSAWRDILTYFSTATHIGLTATPKETKEVSNIEYFGEPIYTYSLKQGISDGYLAPYKVVRMDLDKDLSGWRPNAGQTDKNGQLIEDRVYNQRDFDKNIIMTQRTKLVAKLVSDYLKKTDPMQKTIIFCENIDHAERMRSELAKANPEQIKKNRKYIMRITGDNAEGKAELDNFIDPESPYPVIAVTSKLMTTGVDAKTCKLIVLDQRIQSMTEFKQIIGRGTRIDEDYNKLWFTIIDFKKATELFADKNFDGEPVQVYEPDDDNLVPPDETHNDDQTPLATDSDTPTQEPDSESAQVEGDTTSGAGAGTSTSTDDGSVREPRITYTVDNVKFQVIDQRVQYLDAAGKLITEDLSDYTRAKVQAQFATLKDFLRHWQQADRKQVIIEELAELGVFWDDLISEVGQKLGDEPDPFDVITHIVYGQPALTRRQRAAKTKRRNYFDKYQATARQVLDALLDKYADTGIAAIEDVTVLKLPPFNQLGTPMQLLQAFGNKAQFEQARLELENTLYELDAG